MFGRRLSIVAIFALCGFNAWASPVRLTFNWLSNQPASGAVQVHIRAARMVGDTGSSAPVETGTEAGAGGAVLNLDEGVWQVQAYASGYWSQGAEVTISGQAPASAQVSFWPAAYLSGEIAEQSGSLPQSLNISLSAAQSSSGQAASPSSPQAAVPQTQPAQPDHAELNCPIENGKWSCVGPAGVFNVRIAAEGFAPRYDWSVNLKAGASTDLGQTQLSSALSVFGRAVGKDGSNPPGPCLATLEPYAVRSFGPGPQQDNAPPDEKTYTVPVTQEGYFQFVGVMHGWHLLTVECLAASGITPVQVQPDGETRLDSPLALQDVTLDIAVTPKTDPEGQPWKLMVELTTPRLLRVANGATTGANGHWTRNGLMAGNYRVFVSDSGGMEWLRQDFELSANSKPLALHLASVKVAGKATMSGQPVRARLLFSNHAGGDPVTLISDAEGNFAGRLPITPGAQESIWSVEARVDHPEMVLHLDNVDVPTVPAGSTASIDLELPTIPVRGIVLSQDNQPQNGAQVTFQSDGGFQDATSTEGDGSFEMADLPPGKYNAVAQSSYGISDPKSFSVGDGSGSELKLILHPYLQFPIYVLSSGKDPIPDAAVQIWVAPGVPKAFGHTDQNGRLLVTLPPGTNEIGLTVGAPDDGLALTKMSVPTTPPDSSNSDQPSDDNTVTLDPNGGTLMLNFQPSDGTLDRSAMLYLVHNGSIADAHTLSGWGTDQAGSDSEGPAEVDGVEPGDYSLCVVMNPSQLALLWQGTVPKQSCATGTLKAGQTLTLSPVMPSQQTQDQSAQ